MSNHSKVATSALCVTLMSGCGLIFGFEEGKLEDGSGANGASSSGAAGPGGSGSGAAGAAGGGGSGASGASGGSGAGIGCTALPPFDVFTSAEVNDADLDNENIVTATQPGENRVNVAVNIGDQGARRIAARTVRVNAAIEKSPIVIFPMVPDGIDRRIAGAYATASHFKVWGFQNNQLGEFLFLTNSEIGDPNVTFSPYPQPVECQNIEAVSLSVGFDGEPRFAATCRTNTNPSRVLLFGGRTTGVLEFTIGPVNLDTMGNIPPDMDVKNYLRVAGEHVIIVGNEPAAMRRGDAGGLQTVIPIAAPPNQLLLFVNGPATTGSEVFLGALRIDPNSITTNPDGVYATGLVGLESLDELATDAVGTLGHDFPLDSLPELAPPFEIKATAQGFVGGAASNFDISSPSRARVFLWDAVGEPQVVGFPAFEGLADQVLAATAAPAGFGGLLSLWVEQTAGVSSMRAARVQCVAN